MWFLKLTQLLVNIPSRIFALIYGLIIAFVTYHHVANKILNKFVFEDSHRVAYVLFIVYYFTFVSLIAQAVAMLLSKFHSMINKFINRCDEEI